MAIVAFAFLHRLPIYHWPNFAAAYRCNLLTFHLDDALISSIFFFSLSLFLPPPLSLSLVVHTPNRDDDRETKFVARIFDYRWIDAAWIARAWHASTSKWTSGAPHRRVMHRLLANRSIGNAGYRPPKRKRSSTDSCKIIDLRPDPNTRLPPTENTLSWPVRAMHRFIARSKLSKKTRRSWIRCFI